MRHLPARREIRHERGGFERVRIEGRSLAWRRREHDCYHLRTTLELEDRQLWRIHITLTRVEDAFRSLKSDQDARETPALPGDSVFHQSINPVFQRTAPPVPDHSAFCIPAGAVIA